MKLTSDDFEPRRDGYFEHRGTWQEVTLGTILANREKRSEKWEIVDVAMATHVEHGMTLWMRAREMTTGAEITIRPRLKTYPVRILTLSPLDTKTAAPTPPSDVEAILLLIRELGAEVLASRDNETGEIVCPDYASGHNHIDEIGGGALSRGEVEHMRLAHGMTVDDGIDVKDLTILHGQAHNPKWPNIGKGGFPHRHVPEDLTIL